MPMSEQELVLKTIESSALLTGGQLNPKQQKEFFRLIRSLPGMFNICRFETVDQKRHHIDRLHIGEPITHAVEENSNEAHLAVPKTSQIEIHTKKVKSSWNITTEALVENIEKGNFEQTIMESMTERIGTDLELLAIQGNAEKYKNDNSPLGLLLRRDDGWDVLTEGAHIVDCGGSTIQRGIFAEMIRRMPPQYLADPGLRWIVSRSTMVDWMDLIADRGTAQGDRALEGQAPAPYGIPMVAIPLIPTDKELTVSTATPAKIISTRADAFRILSGVNDKILISVDGEPAVTVTLPQGTWFASQIAHFINSAHTSLAGIASDDGFGRLVLTSKNVGSTGVISIQDIENNAYAELGLSVGDVTGKDEGFGVVYEGTFIWLANPKNFIVAMLNGTRVYSEFNKDYDRLETVVYNEIDVQVENLDAIVKAVNIRKRTI